MAQNVSVWLFTHLRVIAVASFLCCHFSDTQVEIIFIRKWYLMLHINIFLCHLCFPHSLLAAGLPFLYALPPAHSPGIIPLGYFLSFSLSAGQLLLPPLLSLLNSGFFSYLSPLLLSLSSLFLCTNEEYTPQIPQDNASKPVQLQLLCHPDLLRMSAAPWLLEEGRKRSHAGHRLPAC